MSIAARNAILAGGAAPGPTPTYWGLCFTAEQANSTVRISKSGSPTSPMTILYSTDAVNWSAYTIGTDIVLENVGDKVWMKAGEGGNSGSWFTSAMSFYRFKMTGLIAASGNLMSIVDGETETFTAKVFRSLFQGCTSLTTAPALPATTLVNSCYNSMFYGCTGLTSAPALPATTLAKNCYNYMFNGCTGLTSAPALPATTLVDNCYNSMFRHCTSLTTAPALPATTLAKNCYCMMFDRCSSLISAPAVLPAETLVAGTNIDSGCYAGMFYGCTSLTTAPALPATTLASYCYSQMFYGCTSLTATPLLPATSLPTRCYFEMFSGCTSLTTVRTAQTQAWGDGTSDDPTYQWVNGVAASGTFYCPTALGTNATITRGVSACPEGWTVVNTDA